MAEVIIDGVKYFPLSWFNIQGDIERLGEKIEAKVNPEVIIGILRWGAVVACLLSDYLGLRRVYALGCSYYRGVQEKGGRVEVYQEPNLKGFKGKEVLLVDDVSDSGATLAKAKKHLVDANLSPVYTATLHVKPWTSSPPDFYVKTYDGWVVYPWSNIEALSSVIRKMTGKGITREEALKTVKEKLKPSIKVFERAETFVLRDKGWGET